MSREIGLGVTIISNSFRDVRGGSFLFFLESCGLKKLANAYLISWEFHKRLVRRE
jgi:hypothetical protein